jgi:hypothetical protein
VTDAAARKLARPLGMTGDKLSPSEFTVILETLRSLTLHEGKRLVDTLVSILARS